MLKKYNLILTLMLTAILLGCDSDQNGIETNIIIKFNNNEFLSASKFISQDNKNVKYKTGNEEKFEQASKIYETFLNGCEFVENLNAIISTQETDNSNNIIKKTTRNSSMKFERIDKNKLKIDTLKINQSIDKFNILYDYIKNQNISQSAEVIMKGTDNDKNVNYSYNVNIIIFVSGKINCENIWIENKKKINK